MATSTTQDDDFKVAVINDSLLEDAIEWIGKNLDPDEVFEKDMLDEWISKQGWILGY